MATLVKRVKEDEKSDKGLYCSKRKGKSGRQMLRIEKKLTRLAPSPASFEGKKILVHSAQDFQQ